MIEPVLSGQELLKEIHTTSVSRGRLAVWWLGQSGFLFKSDRAMVLIDPYLSESLTLKYALTDKPHVRMTRCPIDPRLLSGIDLVLCSHKHSDHMDPGTLPALVEASPSCRFVIPASLSDHAVGLGVPIDRQVRIDHGDSVQFRELGICVRAVKAAHETLETDDRGRFMFLSFVIEISGVRVFHSGDTMPWVAQAESIGPGLDIAFLPINGRDPGRHVAGNMNSDQAVKLAARLGVATLVPHHYDMFTFNTVDVAEFVAASNRLPKSVRPVILRCGERFMTTSKPGK